MSDNEKHILHRIYENIDLVIKDKGINKGDVEEAIGVSQGYFSRRCSMSAVTLYKLSKVLGVNMDYLCSNRLKVEKVEAQIKDLQEVLQKLKHIEAYDLAIKALEERPQGEWRYGEDEYGQDGWFCSECGFFVPWYYQYVNNIDFIREYKACPHCLADMQI